MRERVQGTHSSQTLWLRQVEWWHICPSRIVLHMQSPLPLRAQEVSQSLLWPTTLPFGVFLSPRVE